MLHYAFTFLQNNDVFGQSCTKKYILNGCVAAIV